VVGVLVMAHGTPETPEGIHAFYTSIRRGRPPGDAELADLEARYRTIGGTSPLAARTRAQVDGLAVALESRAPGRYAIGFGAKHTSPTIEDGMAELCKREPARIVGLVLTPHRSGPGSGEYLSRAAAAAGAARPDVPFIPIPDWWAAPGFADLLADRVDAALDGGGGSAVLFTAHSLPARVIDGGDPYAEQVAASAAEIAAVAGLDDRGVAWSVAWQSAGRTPEPWIGPDLGTEIRRLAAAGVRAVVVCPVGFVADHLEVLYDIDVEAAAVAAAAGLPHFGRTASLNDDPRFVAVLADVVAAAAGEHR
jgi:ferrochelatase